MKFQFISSSLNCLRGDIYEISMTLLMMPLTQGWFLLLELLYEATLVDVSVYMLTGRCKCPRWPETFFFLLRGGCESPWLFDSLRIN